jgi:hypothetical protein
MPKALTTGATVKCSHQGTVGPLAAGQAALKAGGAAVLVEGDLVGATIAGCTLSPSPSTTPCTATTSMLAGAATKLKAGGKAVLLETAKGLTNSVPPGTWSVESAGQSALEAS